MFGVNVSPDDLETTTGPARGHKNEASRISSGDSVQVDKSYLEDSVLKALFQRLRIRKGANDKDDEQDTESSASNNPSSLSLPKELLDVRVVRRSLDARRKRRSPGTVENASQSGPLYNYVIDVDVRPESNLRLKHQSGRLERLSPTESSSSSATAAATTTTASQSSNDNDKDDRSAKKEKKKVVIVGAGPAGLFCALVVARSGVATPIVLERGQPVESRGKDIGMLVNRRQINRESNFVFGEGGAGTWSDGKLTTRIGRNSNAVRFVLETLVRYGAPEGILVDGSPHLGTDNLVRLLRNMRADLRELGGEVRFGAKMTNLFVEDGVTRGVRVSYGKAMERYISGNNGKDQRNSGQTTTTNDGIDNDWETEIMADAVVVATGHSARDVYEELHAAGVQLEAKGFAAGFRVEHPQKLINEIQYGHEWGPSVVTGKGTTDRVNLEYFGKSTIPNDDDDATTTTTTSDGTSAQPVHSGRLPVPSYRLATDQADDGETKRGAYSFCMCPGGQIVPSSTEPDEVCVNGMSFSRRDSLWANAALVVTVSPDDKVLDPYREEHGVLAGIAFQRDMERRAAVMGGGNFTVPVQRLTDFVAARSSTTAPSSSYRLGVKPSACHEIYPAPMTAALQDAVANHFNKKMPGFLCEEGLLHAVETRTSSPVRVSRHPETMQAIGTTGLFPPGEGAGFAGGIVSAAVDGMSVADAILETVCESSPSSRADSKGSKKGIGFSY